jgi:hypothetical protein
VTIDAHALTTRFLVACAPGVKDALIEAVAIEGLVL